MEQLAQLVEQATGAAPAWRAQPLKERIKAVAGIKERLLDGAETIGRLLSRELGKPFAEGVLSEVLASADVVEHWCLQAESLLAPQSIAIDATSYPDKRGTIVREARGVVALITPWNYPIAIALRTIVPALLAGNAVVFKPSEHSPRCGAMVAELFSGLLPSGVLQLVQGDGEQGRALVEAEGVDLVVFTGSVATGKSIARSCAERLRPHSLELGGKDAAIVLDDCNLQRTARGIVWGAFTNAGQNCAAIERVYVTKGVADDFVRALRLAVAEVDAGSQGLLTTAAQRDHVRKQLEEAIAAGAEPIVGGLPPDAEQMRFPPTVLRIEKDAAPMSVMEDETFGPLLTLSVVADVAEAIEKTNASRYALSTSIWTREVEAAMAHVPALRSGVVTINNHGFTGALPAAPWTGTGDTGYGITNSAHCLSSLSRVRFVLEDFASSERELWWYPYTPALERIAVDMATLRGGKQLEKLGAAMRLVPNFLRRIWGRDRRRQAHDGLLG